MSAKRSKSLLYVTAKFFDEDSKSLEYYARKSFEKLSTVKDRIVEMKDKHFCGTYYKNLKTGFAIQICSFVQGELATVIKTSDLSVETLELGELAAPDGVDYSDGDVICYIEGNDIFTCASVITWKVIAPYLRELFEEAELGEQAVDFDIIKPADFNKLAMIKEQGVHDIVLNLPIGSEDFYLKSYTKKRNKMSFIVDMVKNYMFSEEDIKESLTGTSSSMKISLKLGDTPVSFGLQEAEKILLNYDSFCITTKEGKRITDEEITVSTKVRIEPLGKSVLVGDTIKALKEFRNEVKDITRV